MSKAVLRVRAFSRSSRFLTSWLLIPMTSLSRISSSHSTISWLLLSVQVLINIFVFLVGTVEQVTLKNNIPLWFKMLPQDLCDQLQADFKLFGKFLFPELS